MINHQILNVRFLSLLILVSGTGVIFPYTCYAKNVRIALKWAGNYLHEIEKVIIRYYQNSKENLKINEACFLIGDRSG